MDFEMLLRWLRRLASLDTRVFDEVANNPRATLAGSLVVVASMFLAGLGGYIWWLIQPFGDDGDILVDSFIIGSIVATVLWHLVWLGGVIFIMKQLFRERVYMEQLLRVMGLASAPMALMLFMFIPGISMAVGLTALVMTFGLTGIALQRVTTADPARVLVANAAGFLVWASLLTLFAGSGGSGDLSPYAPGIFLYETTNNYAADFYEGFNLLQ